MLTRKVIFTELSQASMKRLMPDESQRESMKASMTWYLRRDAEGKSIRCPAFDDLDVYIYAFSKYRVLFELREADLRIWSVALLAVARAG